MKTQETTGQYLILESLSLYSKGISAKDKKAGVGAVLITISNFSFFLLEVIVLSFKDVIFD